MTKKKAAPTKKPPKPQIEPETGGEITDTLTLEDLVAAADDISECLALEPPIQSDLEEDKLRQSLIGVGQLLEPLDITSARVFERGTPISKRRKGREGPFLAIETLEVLEALGVELPEEKPAEKPPAKKKAAPAPPKKKAPPKDPFTNPGACTFIMMETVANPDVTLDEMKTLLEEAGLTASDGTASIQMNDTKKTVRFMKSLGWAAPKS